MTDIKVGQKYRVRMGGIHPFSDGKTLEIFKVDTHVYYAYEGNTGLSRHNRPAVEFEAYVHAGVLIPVEEAVAPVAAPKTTMVEIGARYAIGKHSGPFISDSEIEVTNVDKMRVKYFYTVKNDGSTCTKDLPTFERLMRDGVITKIEKKPMAPPPAPPPAPEPAPVVRVGEKYQVGKRTQHFADNQTIEITKVDQGLVFYHYPVADFASQQTMRVFKESLERGELSLIREPVKVQVTEAPTRAPTMPEAMAAPYGNPFEVKPKSLFDVDYSQLEQRAAGIGELVMNAQGMAQHVHSPTMRMPKSRQEEANRYMETLSKILKRFIGQTATRTMHEEILQACRMNLPSRFKPSVQFDERGAFVGVKIRDRGTTDSYYVPPECRPRSPAQPEVLPELTMHGPSGEMLDRLAQHCGVHRARMESDVSLRDRIKERMLTKGASAPKVNEESNPAQPINKVEKTMSRIVNVFLFDNTLGLKADQRLIGKVENIATDGNDQQVLMEVAVNHDIGTMLKEHNLKRKAIINQDILERVGKTVYMQPIELAQVTYQVVEVVRSR